MNATPAASFSDDAPFQPKITTPLLSSIQTVVDEDTTTPNTDDHVGVRKNFWRIFFKTKSTKQLVLVAILIGVGLGSVVGLVSCI